MTDAAVSTASASPAESVADSSVRVSVIIPVYNPGRYLDDCIASLLRQDMPAKEFEAIFVDDGSTDGSPRRLDELAATHPHMRVIHQDNSGWSGKPRNVGIDAARGEYVYFVDNDDWLGDQALRRMYDFAKANDSDIVVGKMVGKGRPAPRELFRKTVPRATFENSLIIDSLTPQKLFRKAFLDRHGLRFPEGKRRLEDHVFVIAAYFAAETISVLSDYVCYYHVRRAEEASAGYSPIEPIAYFGYLREALDIVAAHTEPGPLRDRIYRRWYRVEMLERLRGKRLLDTPADDRGPLLNEIRQIIAERFGPGVGAPLAPAYHVIGSLVQAGRLDDLLSFASWEADIAAGASLDDLGWHSGILHLTVTADLHDADGRLTFVPDGDRDTLEVRRLLSPDGLAVVADNDLDCAAWLRKSKLDVLVRNRKTSAEYVLPAKVSRTRQPVDSDGADAPDSGLFAPVLQGKAALDIATAASGLPLPDGVWDIVVRLWCCGWMRETALGSVRSSAAADGCVPGLLGGDPGRVVTPYWTDDGNLAVDIGETTRRLASAHLMRDLPHVGYGDSDLDLQISVPLTAAVLQPVGVSAIKLFQDGSVNSFLLPATLSPVSTDGTARPTLSAEYHGELDPGRWYMEIRLTDAGQGTFVRLPAAIIAPLDGGLPVVEAAALPTSHASRVRRFEILTFNLLRSSARRGRRLAGRVRRWIKPRQLLRR